MSSLTRAADFVAAKHHFAGTCGGCHGSTAFGGDRAPALIDNATLRQLNAAGIVAIITSGSLRAMPAFASRPADQVTKIAADEVGRGRNPY
ncbi:c-type cytochrome [Sphingomonas natans]|uniref:c-type cytochrome n=1 Tax=Sphingomonas natans TaxID=3063330 RepID=UPI003D66A5C9